MYSESDYEAKQFKKYVKSTIVGVIAFFSFIMLMMAFEVVSPGERGVVIRLGAVQERVLEEGFHVLVPFTESVKIMDVTVQKYTSGAESASKDLQTVYTEIALNYHLDPLRVNDIYQTFRGEEILTFIEPSIEEAVKAGTAQYTAEELITQRASVKDAITVEMKTRLEPYGFLVDGMSIIDFSFSESFDKAIEEKVTAEQNALAEENRLKQVEFKSQQRVVEAEAEAEAIRIQAEAIQNQGGAEYVNLKAVEAWDGVLPVYMMPDSSVPFINLN